MTRWRVLEAEISRYSFMVVDAPNGPPTIRTSYIASALGYTSKVIPPLGRDSPSVALKNGTSMLRVGVRNWRVTSFLFSSARYTWPFCKNTQIGSRLPTGRCVSSSNTSALSDGFLELTAEPACTPVGAVSV
jgi:hypothetical protein